MNFNVKFYFYSIFAQMIKFKFLKSSIFLTHHSVNIFL